VVWRDKFLPVNRIDKEQRAAILKNGGDARRASRDPSRLPECWERSVPALASLGRMTLSVL